MLIKITRLACIVVSGHSLLASIHMNRLPTVKCMNMMKLESVRTLLKITQLTSLVSFWDSIQMKIAPKVSLCPVGICCKLGQGPID